MAWKIEEIKMLDLGLVVKWDDGSNGVAYVYEAFLPASHGPYVEKLKNFGGVLWGAVADKREANAMIRAAYPKVNFAETGGRYLMSYAAHN